MADFFDMCDITQRQVDVELNELPEVRKAKLDAAADGAEFWKSIAPVGDPKKDPHSGQYKESIHIQDKKGVAVVADAPNAWFVEYGTNGIHESACRVRTETYLQKKLDSLKPEGE